MSDDRTGAAPPVRAENTPFQPIDVNAWIGEYPFRALPHPDPAVLVRVLAREGFDGAWVGHLPGAFHRDPSVSNRTLFTMLEPHRDVLFPTPVVRPDWPKWERVLIEVAREHVPAIRVYPAQWGLAHSAPLSELAIACGEAGIVLHVTVRFEDLRQRHAMDTAGDVSAATLRAIARTRGSRCHMLVAGAGRELIEETHWGLTPTEQQRVTYDFSWLWGPPAEHFAHVVRSIGPERLAWSTCWPLRLAQQGRALVALLPSEIRALAPDDVFSDGRRLAAAALATAVSAREQASVPH